MQNLASRGFCLLWLIALWLHPGNSDSALLSSLISPAADGVTYNITMVSQVFTNSDGTVPGPDLSGSLLAITNDAGDVPFSTPVQTPLISIWYFQAFIPADVLSTNYTLIWPNYTLVLAIGSPLFRVQPQPQSVLVGGAVTFEAQAIHSPGFIWQKNGTNVVEDGRISGVTNSSLTLTNVQLSDAGIYQAVTIDPTNQVASFDAQLSVFKPIRLDTENRSPTAFSVLVVNRDGSPFETNRIPNLTIFSSSDLIEWQDVTEEGFLTNDAVRFDYPFNGSTNCFWRVLESPPSATPPSE